MRKTTYKVKNDNKPPANDENSIKSIGAITKRLYISYITMTLC